MKTKTTLFSVLSFMILLPLIINTNAITYTADIERSPFDVYKGDTVIISVEVNDMVREEEITSARLSSFINAAFQPSINPEQSIPMQENLLAFTIGPFVAGDIVRYKIYLEFNYAEDYASDWFEFTLPSGSRPLLTNTEIILIVSAVIIIALITYSIIRRRKK